MRRSRILATLVGLGLIMGPPEAPGQSLRGSMASLERQNREARRHDLSYLRTRSQLRRFVDMGLLVPVEGNRDYRLASVSFPYARPAVRLFLERLSRQYRAACGEVLVVTSLTRPTRYQPRNASSISVHPTGIAMDLRRSRRAACRRWLEGTLLWLEGQGMVEATRERRPPHYHVAVFPGPYQQYVARRLVREGEARVAAGPTEMHYRVRRGDTLWGIARSYGVSVNQLKQMNGLADSRILPGQVLTIQVGR